MPASVRGAARRCRAWAATPPPPWPASPSGSATRSWTRTCAGCWPAWCGARTCRRRARQRPRCGWPSRCCPRRPAAPRGGRSRSWNSGRWSARPPGRSAPAARSRGSARGAAPGIRPGRRGRRAPALRGQRPRVPRPAARACSARRRARCRRRRLDAAWPDRPQRARALRGLVADGLAEALPNLARYALPGHSGDSAGQPREARARQTRQAHAGEHDEARAPPGRGPRIVPEPPCAATRRSAVPRYRRRCRCC